MIRKLQFIMPMVDFAPHCF